MDSTQFNELMKKMDTLIKLLTANVIKGKSKTDQILFWSDLGFDNKQIADIVGTTPLTVRVTKSSNKKKKLSKKKTKQKEGKITVESKPKNP